MAAVQRPHGPQSQNIYSMTLYRKRFLTPELKHGIELIYFFSQVPRTTEIIQYVYLFTYCSLS